MQINFFFLYSESYESNFFGSQTQAIKKPTSKGVINIQFKHNNHFPLRSFARLTS